MRAIRRLHLWIGAWGAIAAVLFGFTGFVQNHRAVLKLPQGESTELSRVQLPIPAEAGSSPESVLNWLRDMQHLNLESQRAPLGRSRESDAPRGRSRDLDVPQGQLRDFDERRGVRWMFTGGNARKVIQAEYTPGADTVLVRTTVQSPLATLARLHKGVGGGIAWTVLSDSFALGLIALGLSGLTLWSRGRSARQMVFSIVGAAVLVLVLVGASAIA